ncbi:MAG: MFS transporter [Deltaproteobacteria bacterium]|nr:MFS transporter [Deltaproteobacteria bacterium]
MSAFGGLLDVRPEERRNTFAAFSTLLALTTGHTLLETARDALFLAKIPTTHLPWMYLLIVAIALAISQIPAARADSKMGVAGSLLVAAGITGAFWALVPTKNPSVNALYALYVWTGLFASWAMVQFWTLLGRVHTMTQAKRLYGFIGGGSVLGAVIGALVARAAMSLSPRTSILFAAIIFALAALPCLALSIPATEKDTRREDHDAEKEHRRPLRAAFELLWENAFARRVLGIVLVSTVTVTIADFLFKSEIAREIKDPRELGRFLSTFYAGTNALALLAQLFIAPWLFRRHGVQRALFVFPALMLTAAAGVLASGGRIAAAVAMKALDGGLRYSIHKTSTELLLVPVPDGVRERIKPIVDLIGARGGQALASIGILALVAASAAQAETLGAIVLTLAVSWIALVVTIRALYLDVFRETLRSGGLSGKGELPELDLGALETLFEGLNSSRDADVIASLELLAEQHRERLIPALILYHPSREVVLRALELFTEMRRSDFVSIADRLNEHPDREVAAAALRARTAVQPNRELLEKRLGERCQEVGVTALVALMARGWIDRADAEKRLAAVLERRSWRVVSELARSIRTIAVAGAVAPQVADRFDDLLLELDAYADSLREVAATELEGASVLRPGDPAGLGVAHPDVRVKLEIARAMAERKNPKFLRVLVQMLRRHELRAAARAALVGMPGALEVLDEALGHPDTPREIRVHLPRTICLFEPRAAAEVLLRHLTQDHGGAVRYKVIRGLVKLKRLHPEITLDPKPIATVIDSLIAHAEELRRWSVALTRDTDAAPPGSAERVDPLRAAHHLLVDLVKDKEQHATQRLFLLFELDSGDQYDDIWRGLRSPNPKQRASSLELLENLVQPPLRRRVLALVSDSGLPEGSAPLTYEEAVLQMIAHDSSTMRTLAVFRAHELGIDVGVADRPSEKAASALETTLGQRLMDTARDLLSPEPTVRGGATRAPA